MDEPIILLKNKYPVLENAYQTVLIETDDCHGELSTYSKEHLHRLMSLASSIGLSYGGNWTLSIGDFFQKSWTIIRRYASAHPHMQIIGLDDIDYKENVTHEMFEGIVIEEKDGSSVYAFDKTDVLAFMNLILKWMILAIRKRFRSYLQMAVHYILNHFPFKATSYNLFFHHIDNKIYAKVVSRFVTTPLYIGYGIPQVPNNLEWMAMELKRIYFNNGRNKLWTLPLSNLCKLNHSQFRSCDLLDNKNIMK